jgi:hypothetical protein
MLNRQIALLVYGVLWTMQIAHAQPTKSGFHWESEKVVTGWERVDQSKSLSPTQRTLLTRAIAAQIRPWMSTIPVESEADLQTLVGQTQIKKVLLGKEGGGEFLASASGSYFCSPTGNCQVWVFRLHDNKYSLILQHPVTQIFTIQSAITNGFHDLVLGQHGSATEEGLTWYQFDGSKYRRVACYDARFDFLGKDGEYHTRKVARLTPVICSFRE